MKSTPTQCVPKDQISYGDGKNPDDGNKDDLNDGGWGKP